VLHAILKGKMRGFLDKNTENGLSFRETYSAYEDFLTASVISRMAYLPSELFWEVIKRSHVHCSLKQASLPEFAGNLVNIEFWPNWVTPDSEAIYCQPDVFLEFEKIDVIVEAKKNDSQLQNTTQLAKQLQSYFYMKEKEENDKKTILLWTLGGMGKRVLKSQVKDFFNKIVKLINFVYDDIHLISSSWFEILLTILNIRRFLVTKDKEFQHIYYFDKSHLLRIVDDIIDGFRLHGIKEWFFLYKLTNYWADENIAQDSLIYFQHNFVGGQKSE
jgi:hypothetical protein